MSKPVQWLLIAFLIPLVLLVAVGIFSTYSNYQLDEAFQQWEHTQQVVLQSEKIISTLKDTESGVRGFIYIRDTTFLEPYINGRKQIISELKTLDSLLTPTAPQKAKIVKLNKLAFKKIVILDSILQIVKTEENLSRLRIIILMRNGKGIMDDARELVNGIIAEEQVLQTALNDAKIYYSSRVRVAQWMVIFFGIVFFTITYWRMAIEWKKRTQYERKLEKQVFELEAHNQQLEAFSFVLSHHLQEPLRKLGTFTDKLQLKYSTDLSEGALHLIRRIGLFSGQISKMVEGIHVIANLHKQNQEQWTRFSLQSAMDEVLNVAAEKIKSTSAIIKIEGEFPLIRGNFRQLRLLFSQILDNSLTFVEPERIPLINVRASIIKGNNIDEFAVLSRDNDFLEISFSDNGIGFSSEFSGKVFEIFQKLDQIEQEDGLGIGLAMCKKIVLNHDGIIVAESQSGKGTIIKIFLPIL